MRKSTVILAGLIGFSSWVFATEPDVIQLPANFDAWNLNFKFPLEKLPVPENPTPAVGPSAKPDKMQAIHKEGAQATEYFVAAQKYHKSYSFCYEGGDIVTYPIDIRVVGDKVIISRLFNLEAQSTEWSKGVDYDITGTYDAVAGTITIPTSTNFSNATLAGTIGDYYTEVLAAGVVTEDGKLAPADELIFSVIGNFEAITTDTSFGILNFTNDGGTSFGAQTLYRGFYASLPSQKPKLLSFNDSFTLADSFAGQGTQSFFSVVNVSDADVDFAVECDSDGDSFSAHPEVGVIPARSVQEFNVNFLPVETGEYEGMVQIEYDGLDTTPEPIIVFYSATAIPTPDFSPAVKSGDFSFSTNIEFPFEITSLSDGTQVARSTTNGSVGTSRLNIEFEVPEGNIGLFSWKGECTNTGQWYQNAGGYFIDDSDVAVMKFTGEADDISGSLEFAPGRHSVRFQYEGLYYTGDQKNGLYVRDLEFVSTPAQDNSAVNETPDVNLPNLMIKDDNGVEAQGTVILRNKGLNPLKITNVSSSSGNFIPICPSGQAGILETIEIPVMFRTADPGQYEAEILIETTAGNITANVKVLVRRMADFSSVVTSGAECVTGFSTDDSCPFEVENGVAYNANSGEADDMATNSWFQIDFTIPEGKAGYLTWDGVLFGHMPDAEVNWNGDMGRIDISHPMSSGSLNAYPGSEEAGSDLFANDDFWNSYLIAVPGNHSIRFNYMKNGDGLISEKDRMEISNFCIRVEDFREHDVQAATDEVIFGRPIYVGDDRYLTATVKLTNTGSLPLEVTDCTSSHPFYGIVPTGQIQFSQTIDVGVWFYPSEEGEFEGTITFTTSGGDVDIRCYGSTKEAQGILLIGDVENKGAEWSTYDADGDGDGWNLGYNLWGINPEWVHEGDECFGSTSYSPYYGAVQPDNWLISPSVNVPENGAMLRWYAAAHHHERYAENYSVYISTPDCIRDPENLFSLEPVFSETLKAEAADEWVENVVDLSNYAGQDIVVLFRHHDCNGQYVLKLDDIFVYDMQKWESLAGIDLTENSNEVISTEIYDINGIRTRGLVKGVNIVRATYADGSVKTTKIIVK